MADLNNSSEYIKKKQEYSDLLSLPQWKNKRSAILQRDGNKCCSCGSTLSLNVHHRQYHINQNTQKYILPWGYANKYLITLCENCHKAGHANYKVPVFNINHN